MILISRLAANVADYIVGAEKREEIRYIKIKYISEVLISEISKLLIIAWGAILLGKVKEYLFIILVLAYTRRFIGGLHAKTYLGCLSLSFFCFVFSVAFESVRTKCLVLVYLEWIFFVAIFGTVSSENRIMPDRKGKYMRRIKASLFVLPLMLILDRLSKKYYSIGAGILLFQLLGIIFEEGRRNVCKRKNN